jgi:chemotaxis protein MotB
MKALMTVTFYAVVFVLGACAIGCGYSEEEMQAKITQIDQLTKALDASRSREAELQSRFDKLGKENSEMMARLQAQNVSVEQLQKAVNQLKEREKQAEARLKTFRTMLERFKNMIASGKLRVRIVKGRMVVELSENILFDSGKAELKAEGASALTEVAEVLKTIADRDFQITGHTDNIPIKTHKYPSNWELSAARAVTVARYLADKGVSSERLSAAGYAETQPVATNDTPEGRQQNRRIEIVLMPNLQELPDMSALEGLGT